MQDRDPFAEPLHEPRSEHRREPDLRHQEDRLLSPPHRLAHQLDVHLGFSAAGDPFDEKWRERSERRFHRIDREILLVGVPEIQRAGAGFREERVHRMAPRPPLGGQHAAPQERIDRRGARAGGREGANRRLSAPFAEEVDDHSLLRREIFIRDCERDPTVVADASRVRQDVLDRDQIRAAKARDRAPSPSPAGQEFRQVSFTGHDAVEKRAIVGDDEFLERGRVEGRAVTGRPDSPPSLRRHVRRKRGTQHLTERSEVVRRRPAAELHDLRQKRRLLVVENRPDRADSRSRDRGSIDERRDESGRQPRPVRDFDSGSDSDLLPEGLRDGVGERPVDSEGNRHFDIRGTRGESRGLGV